MVKWLGNCFLDVYLYQIKLPCPEWKHNTAPKPKLPSMDCHTTYDDLILYNGPVCLSATVVIPGGRWTGHHQATPPECSLSRLPPYHLHTRPGWARFYESSKA